MTNNKCALYTRFSCNRQETGASIETQLEKCRLQAQLSDTEIVHEIADKVQSGKSLERDGIKTLIELVKAKKINQVIIYRLDRLSRNVSDLNTLIQLFNKYEVSLVSISDTLRTDTVSGRMLINIICSISQGERETLISRVVDSLQFRKKNNLRYTRIIPYGKTLVGKTLNDNELEQSAITVMKELHTQGKSLRTIAKSLTESHYPTRFGNNWSPISVRKILIGQGCYQKAA